MLSAHLRQKAIRLSNYMRWLILSIFGLGACAEGVVSSSAKTDGLYKIVAVDEPYSGFPRENYKCRAGDKIEARAKASHEFNIATYDEFVRYRELALDRGVSEDVVDARMSELRINMNEDMRARFGCEWLYGKDAAPLTFV